MDFSDKESPMETNASRRPLIVRAQVATITFLAIVGLFGTTANAQLIYRVDSSAPPGGNGESWPMAFNDLQLALDVALGGDEIWVARVLLPDGSFGAYRP